MLSIFFIFQELPTYSNHMRPGNVVHQEEPRDHHTSVASDNGSMDFILIPNGSQGAITCRSMCVLRQTITNPPPNWLC